MLSSCVVLGLVKQNGEPWQAPAGPELLGPPVLAPPALLASPAALRAGAGGCAAVAAANAWLSEPGWAHRPRSWGPPPPRLPPR